MDEKFQALLIETLGNQTPEGRVNAGYEAQITRAGNLFFRAAINYYGIDAEALKTIRTLFMKEILERLSKEKYAFLKIPENDPNVQIYQWSTLDWKGVFKFEDGLIDVMDRLADYGRQRARCKGIHVEDD